jgi:arginine decarboxylase
VTELLAGQRAEGCTSTKAWYAYGKFHPLYKHRLAMGVPQDMKNRPTVFCVQSTHKMLPCVLDGLLHPRQQQRARKDGMGAIKEAFMMHGTTSPFYPLIASLDIASAMMDEPTGPGASPETVRYAVEFRKAVAQRGAHRYAKDGDWFLNMLPADRCRIGGKDVDFPQGADRPAVQRRGACMDRCRTRKTGTACPEDVVAGDFAMLDPTKVTILCPGTGCHGKIAKRGCPGAILTKFSNDGQESPAPAITRPVPVLGGHHRGQVRHAHGDATTRRSSASTTALRLRWRKPCPSSCMRIPIATVR